MHILGLDISSSKIGIALLKDDKIIISEVVKFKSNQPLEERALQFEQRIQKIEKHYVIYDVYVEQPAMIKRPVLVNNNSYHLGFKAAQYDEIFK